MHDWQFGNLVNYNYGAIGFPYGKNSSLGISFIMMGVDDIPDTRNALIDLNGNGILDPGERLDPNKITTFSTTDMAFYLTYAKKQTEDFSYGVNLKVIHRSLAEATAWGFGLDVGASYKLFNKWLFGCEPAGPYYYIFSMEYRNEGSYNSDCETWLRLFNSFLERYTFPGS